MTNELLTITCSKETLDLINKSLEFYAKVGSGDFGEIIEHPTFNNLLKNLAKVDNKVDSEYFYLLKGEVKKHLINGRNVISQTEWGLYSDKIDESCIKAYHIHEYINYELNKIKDIKPNYLTRDLTIPYEPIICKNKNIIPPIFNIL